jgi:hypothetical protein
MDVDEGGVRRSRERAWSSCCAVASTADGVIPAMCLDGGAQTPARLHGRRTTYGCGRSSDELHDGELCTARAGFRRRACGAARRARRERATLRREREVRLSQIYRGGGEGERAPGREKKRRP